MRIAITSKDKTGGARVITYMLIDRTSVYLVDIYDKSEQDSISDKDLKSLVKEIR